MRRYDEKGARDRQCDTCDDAAATCEADERDLRSGKPDPREQNEQETEFGQPFPVWWVSASTSGTGRSLLRFASAVYVMRHC